MGLPVIEPPLVNSANPWATTEQDLQALFDSKNTGAVTIRTSLLSGFKHEDKIHQYTFFDSQSHTNAANVEDKGTAKTFSSSINTLGYSPIPLSTYLTMVAKIAADSVLSDEVKKRKPFIISVTGSAEAVGGCYRRIQNTQETMSNPLCMEINLSCPNIPGKPPPAYSASALTEYLEVLAGIIASDQGPKVAIGIKTPPYTYHDQFEGLIDALLGTSRPNCVVDFITATNTLGSSLVLDAHNDPALNSASGEGIGGMAGAAIHPLALGNVRTIRRMLNEQKKLCQVSIIGIGGVSDNDGYRRMRAVGASIVGVGTALGSEGISVFENILRLS